MTHKLGTLVLAAWSALAAHATPHHTLYDEPFSATFSLAPKSDMIKRFAFDRGEARLSYEAVQDTVFGREVVGAIRGSVDVVIDAPLFDPKSYTLEVLTLHDQDRLPVCFVMQYVNNITSDKVKRYLRTDERAFLEEWGLSMQSTSTLIIDRFTYTPDTVFVNSFSFYADNEKKTARRRKGRYPVEDEVHKDVLTLFFEAVSLAGNGGKGKQEMTPELLVEAGRYSVSYWVNFDGNPHTKYFDIELPQLFPKVTDIEFDVDNTSQLPVDVSATFKILKFVPIYISGTYVTPEE
ncbi:MAG: hypothetical protein H6502_01655 [Candidatus Woesearchaeota archaeon]|nr:MAG: hypothetical protein H6502_01655 [Candidatus Woesearchaeota archaeon]